MHSEGIRILFTAWLRYFLGKHILLISVICEQEIAQDDLVSTHCQMWEWRVSGLCSGMGS